MRRSLQISHKRPEFIIMALIFCLALMQVLRHGQLSSFQQVDFSLGHFGVPLVNRHPMMAKLHEYEGQTGSMRFSETNAFLVVCNDINPALVPMFSNFRLVRLGKNETPPEWSSVAFLEPSGCDDNQYVKEAIRRREQSPYLSVPDLPATDDGTWMHGVSALLFCTVPFSDPDI